MATFPLWMAPTASASPPAILLAMVGYWDALTYSGSGNWLNLGTAGSSGDLIPGATTTSPTWDAANKRWSFDGVDDVMLTAGDVNLFDWPAVGTPQTVGLIVTLPNATQNAAGGYVSKKSTSTSNGWNVIANGSSLGMPFSVRGNLSASSGFATALTQNVKALVTNGTTATLVYTKLNNAAQSTGADVRNFSSDNAVPLTVGRSAQTAGIYTTMLLHGMFISASNPSAADLTTIGAYYGLTI